MNRKDVCIHHRNMGLSRIRRVKVSCFTFKRLSMNLGTERGVCLILFFQDEGFYLGLRNEGRGDGVEESWFNRIFSFSESFGKGGELVL